MTYITHSYRVPRAQWGRKGANGIRFSKVMVTVKETEAIPCHRAAKQIAREALVGMAVTPCHAVIAERKPGWRMLEKAYARLAKQRVRAYRGDKYRQWLDANGGL